MVHLNTIPDVGQAIICSTAEPIGSHSRFIVTFNKWKKNSSRFHIQIILNLLSQTHITFCLSPAFFFERSFSFLARNRARLPNISNSQKNRFAYKLAHDTKLMPKERNQPSRQESHTSPVPQIIHGMID